MGFRYLRVDRKAAWSFWGTAPREHDPLGPLPNRGYLTKKSRPWASTSLKLEGRGGELEEMGGLWSPGPPRKFTYYPIAIKNAALLNEAALLWSSRINSLRP